MLHFGAGKRIQAYKSCLRFGGGDKTAIFISRQDIYRGHYPVLCMQMMQMEEYANARQDIERKLSEDGRKPTVIPGLWNDIAYPLLIAAIVRPPHESLDPLNPTAIDPEGIYPRTVRVSIQIRMG